LFTHFKRDLLSVNSRYSAISVVRPAATGGEERSVAVGAGEESESDMTFSTAITAWLTTLDVGGGGTDVV
jgi:hypothetical protein